MDEANQQEAISEAVLKESGCDNSLKRTADEKVTQELPMKSSSDESNSEALNTNGIDKESETSSSNFMNSDVDSAQSQENLVKEEKTSNDNLHSESDIEQNTADKDFSDSLKKCNDKTDNKIHFSLESAEQNISKEEDFEKGDVCVLQEENVSSIYNNDCVSESQLIESTECEKQCTKTDLSEKSEPQKNFIKDESHKDICAEEKNEEINIANDLVDRLEMESNESENTGKQDETNPSKESVSESEIVTLSKEISDIIKTNQLSESKDNNPKILEPIIESGDACCDHASKAFVQQSEEKEKGNEEKDFLLSSHPSAGLSEKEEASKESLPEGTTKDIVDASSLKLESEKQNPVAESDLCESYSEIKNKVTSTINSELPPEFENELAGEGNGELQSEKESPARGTISESRSEAESKTADKNSDMPLEIDVKITDVFNSELQSKMENEITELSKSMTEVSPVENPDKDVIYSLEEKKSDEVDECESSQKQFETDSIESEKETSELGEKSNLQEFIGSQDVSRLNTSAEQEDEESTNRSENEGNEVMDTEMVNCSEIEQIDLSESETDLKGDGRDEEMVADSLETAGEKANEDQMTDEKENSREADKSAMLIDDDGVNQPGNSEEETITGDTTNQSSNDLTKEKDEEICIIPDDVIPALSILPQTKDIGTREEENGGLTVLKVTPSESVKPKTRGQDKRSQDMDSKSRPVRNAAKLAGNKIKSLVESDLEFDEHTLSGDLEGENDFQENTDDSAQMCAQCREVKVCKLLSVQNDVTQYLCSEQCSVTFKAAQMDAEPTESDNSLRQYVRKCGQCHSQITVDENRLFWETVDFCNEDCLGKYQLELGSNCANCKKSVPSTSLGKYCVRFGYDIKQFCSAMCLEEYKKGLKVCSYCQKDISTGAEGFLAPVGSKGQFKDFCTQSCMEKYDRMSSNKPLPEVIEECAVCSNSKPVQVEVELDNKTHKLCSEPCFAAFKFVNNITEGQCDMCRKYFDRSKIPNYSLRLLFYDETLRSFCSKTCMNVYILANRKIVPCNWCKVKKYNFDMIKKVSAGGQLSMMCSLNCLMLYQTSVNAVCSRPIKCDFCKKKFVRQPLYHLTMSDATLRNFCSYNCVMSFQNGYPKQKIDVVSGPDQLNLPIPTGGPKRIAPKRPQLEPTCVPVISSVQSLASPNGPVSPTGRVQISRGDVNLVSQPLSVPASPIPAPPPQIYQQIITKPAPAKQMKNKSILCKPYSHTKGVSCRPHPCMKETQTDQSLNRKFLIPIPVPIYVPAPMHMFATPFPVPVPFPLPVPVPIFIPTTRNSAKGIMKEIKKIQEKIPTDPFEAELLMMAEMVAGDKKQDPTDSESEDGNDGDDNGDGTFSPENVDTSNTFGDDMLQMALKMASELEEPAVDMESVLTSNTITTSTQPTVDPNKALYASDTDDPDQVNVMAMSRGRKRSVRGSRSSSGGTPSKRGRRTSGSVDVPLLPPPEPVPPRTIEVEKPDANMCLKYTFGVNAWRHWVMQKNAELEKAALTNRKIKLFKPELLQLTADELNFSLCLFVKEVRKPNGTEYAPDTIYYLCLGIQQYLFENGRIDNIFTDSYYEKFTDCLDEVAKKFAALYNDSQYIVTRVEEEHLWESKQLGAHSPHVLLSTLMFFNTKHFNLVTVEEHMQLSFSHIMKHWKRNPNTPGVAKVPGSRNVLLRFYPPQSALEANSRKKKVYEQQENEENPLRCPVKLYEFYLSKCPESVKTRNDVFYLLPERSCVPDSPVWYSTMALGKEPLMKMLHRIKMVKEINIALLTS